MCPPFGYHKTEAGEWACDGRRLHIVGDLPDEYWAQVLSLQTHEYGLIAYDFERFYRGTRKKGSALVSIARDMCMGHENDYPVGEPPEGFKMRLSYLADALDFIFGGFRPDEDNEFCVAYHQGVVEVFDLDDGASFSDGHGVPERRCYIAGHLGRQWLLPLNEWLVRREKVMTQPSSANQPRSAGEGRHAKRIEDEYPFPLAYSYHLSLDAASAAEESTMLLRAAENLLAFLGSVTLCLIPAAHRAELGVDYLRLWRGGISPGGWLDTIGRCAKFLRQSHDQLGLALASQLLGKKGNGTCSALHELVCMKNDQKHDRAFGTEDACVRENPRLKEVLEGVYSDLEMLADHPFRLVYSLDVSEKGDLYVLDCFRYQGAFPKPRRERIEWYEAMPKNRLYLEVSEMNWVPLSPFIRRVHCPRCGENELFYVDKMTGDGTALLKSFERGHTVEVPEVAEAIEKWFAG